MDYWMVLSLIVSWLGFVYFIEKIRQRREDEGTRRNLGIPIDKLEDGAVYSKCTPPDSLVFLSKNGEQPKAHTLQGVNVEKLPDVFMFLKQGDIIVPWHLVPLYAEEEIIELKDLAGVPQPA